MSRNVGSGLATVTALAIEELFAALLVGDRDRVAVQQQVLNGEWLGQRCGIAPAQLQTWLTSIVNQAGFPIVQAVASPTSQLGDVEATLSDGTHRWFEVKAQTKKQRFSDLTQADWIRDITDALRFLYDRDPTFAARIPAWAQPTLMVPNSNVYFDGWHFEALWLADFALITSAMLRQQAGVNRPDALGVFLDRKYLLHITQEGARLIQLSAVPSVSSVLHGGVTTRHLRHNRETATAVVVAAAGVHPLGRAHFTYHVLYRSGVLGRHKLHASALLSAPGIYVP